MSAERLGRRDYAVDSVRLAKRLIGQRLVRVLDDGTRLSGIIVETEAYLGAEDRGAHSFGGRRTPRNESMYSAPGTFYVYFTYGMHFCCNVVAGREGEPVAVLLRAAEPEEGIEVMRRNRSARPRKGALRDSDLCSGPGKLCQAMGIDRGLDGSDLVGGGAVFIERVRGRAHPDSALMNTARIGLGIDGEWGAAPLRWALSGNRHVSRGGKTIV
ncbi:MAG: DNA-3-methyladenine glycosylase [Planctomycetota bacterium]|nr:DNA-3-methyladenine glycosylase [Planctomycetota bacterium]